MPTKYVKFTGKSEWAKVYEPELFRGASDWKINVYLDDAELKRRADEGIQSKVYENENGKYVTFKRPQTKLIKGQQQLFCGPDILDKDGRKIVAYKKNAEGTNFDRVGEPVLIGNGSTVCVTVCVYDAGAMGKGQRLESVQVLDLITYVPPSDGSFEKSITVGTAPSVKTPW